MKHLCPSSSQARISRAAMEKREGERGSMIDLVDDKTTDEGE